ncbi:uncharacterized protein LOC142230984 [Haematobia irritans]|uniref:uncharacterized protein LOC142230984 n=1 Tax=Haematobia irritans TaxID=7368 RepID=UPI003F5090A4
MLCIQQFCALVVILLSLCHLVENRSYNNGLIFYDLKTNNTLLPPTVSVSRGRNLAKMKFSPKGSIWSTFGKPCECTGPLCGCCVGIKVKQFNFDQKMCANVTFVQTKQELNLEMFLNGNQSAKYAVSARNPSPFCIPIMLNIPMSMCVQMSDVGLQGDNMHACMDFMVQLATTGLFEMHFQCMQMGAQGAQWVLPAGGPVIPPSQSKLTNRSENDYEEYYDEEMENSLEKESEKAIADNDSLPNETKDENKAEEVFDDENDVTNEILTTQEAQQSTKEIESISNEEIVNGTEQTVSNDNINEISTEMDFVGPHKDVSLEMEDSAMTTVTSDLSNDINLDKSSDLSSLSTIESIEITTETKVKENTVSIENVTEIMENVTESQSKEVQSIVNIVTNSTERTATTSTTTTPVPDLSATEKVTSSITGSDIENNTSTDNSEYEDQETNEGEDEEKEEHDEEDNNERKDPENVKADQELAINITEATTNPTKADSTDDGTNDDDYEEYEDETDITTTESTNFAENKEEITINVTGSSINATKADSTEDNSNDNDYEEYEDESDITTTDSTTFTVSKQEMATNITEDTTNATKTESTEDDPTDNEYEEYEDETDITTIDSTTFSADTNKENVVVKPLTTTPELPTLSLEDKLQSEGLLVSNIQNMSFPIETKLSVNDSAVDISNTTHHISDIIEIHKNIATDDVNTTPSTHSRALLSQYSQQDHRRPRLHQHLSPRNPIYRRFQSNYRKHHYV